MAPMFSALRAPAVAALKTTMICKPNANHLSQIVIRNGGGGRMFVIKPSRYTWNITKDLMHLYILLGVMPTVIVVTAMNAIVGPAELAEIPDGYVPRHWEYFKSPFTRWLAKNFYCDPVVDYEMQKYLFAHEGEKIIMRKIAERVTAIMSNRNDYQSYFYDPVTAKYHRFIREAHRMVENHFNGDMTSDIRYASETELSPGARPWTRKADPDEWRGETVPDPVRFGKADFFTASIGLRKKRDE